MKNEESFRGACEKLHTLILSKIPHNIKEQLLPPKYWQMSDQRACRIYGKKKRGNKFLKFHPYWDNGVSNYFIHDELGGFDRQEWAVGIHFNPKQKICSGNIFGDDVRRLFKSLHGKEGFRFEPDHTVNHSTGFSLTLRVVEKPSRGDATIPFIADKLSWLIKVTWPKIETIIESYPVKDSTSCVRE